MMRVRGRGTAEAAFLPTALTDNDARRDLQTVTKSDKRVAVVGLYHITQITFPADQIQEPCLYLHTGIKRKERGDVLNIFFYAASATDAVMWTVARGWDKENKLYRCHPIPMI